MAPIAAPLTQVLAPVPLLRSQTLAPVTTAGAGHAPLVPVTQTLAPVANTLAPVIGPVLAPVTGPAGSVIAPVGGSRSTGSGPGLLTPASGSVVSVASVAPMIVSASQRAAIVPPADQAAPAS